MAQIIVIFSKPIFLPDDKMKRLKTYGLVFEKTEKTTFERITDYTKRYIFAVAELYKEGIENIDEWSYKKNGVVYYVNGPFWHEYVEKAEKKKIRLAIIDDDSIEIKDNEMYDRYLLTNKEKWDELKAMKKIE